ncbi:MAG: effector binding domain-containing protein [Longicatena sp.]
MSVETITLDNIFLLIRSFELSSSLTKNTRLAQNYWIDFNQTIKENQLQQGHTFEKYAITRIAHDTLYYSCGIVPKESYPRDFELFLLPRASYLKYKHKGSLLTLKDSVRFLFEDYIPTHHIKVLASPIKYFEKYTNEFSFTASDSIIELYIPIEKEPTPSFPCIPTKSILAGSGFKSLNYQGFSWFGMDYNMNLYKGCCHGCIYCDSRSACYRVENFDIVRGKENELVILEAQLKSKKRKGTIGVGAMSDSYNPFEKEQSITKDALKLIERYGFGVGIDTKSTLILRDIDILQRISKNYPSIVKFTITCANDTLASIIEPHASLSSERFMALEQLHQAGIYAGVLLMPLLPFINDTLENVKGIVQFAHQHHAKFIYPSFSVTLRDQQRDYFYYQLDKYFPGKRALYEKYYHKTYDCTSLHAKELFSVFETECKKYNIKYHMSDIIEGYKKNKIPEQITLEL